MLLLQIYLICMLASTVFSGLVRLIATDPSDVRRFVKDVKVIMVLCTIVFIVIGTLS